MLEAGLILGFSYSLTRQLILNDDTTNIGPDSRCVKVMFLRHSALHIGQRPVFLAVKSFDLVLMFPPGGKGLSTVSHSIYHGLSFMKCAYDDTGFVWLGEKPILPGRRLVQIDTYWPKI